MEFKHYRLDQFLAKKMPKISRSLIQKIIKAGKVMINGKSTDKASQQVVGHDVVSIDIPAPKIIEAGAEEIPLDIIYEDHDLVIINKPIGMVVHPAQGHSAGTLVNALLHHCKDLSGIGGAMRPGIVHRLDRETSWLMVIAKHDGAHQKLSNDFRDRKVNKKYLALVHGLVKSDSGTIDVPIGRSQSDRKKMAVIIIRTEKEEQDHKRKHRKVRARDSVTHYKVVARFKDTTLVELKLETGRTHQIRVHMAYLRHPIVGDKAYGLKKDKEPEMFLNSYLLGFNHPVTGAAMEFKKLSVWAQDLLDKSRAVL